MRILCQNCHTSFEYNDTSDNDLLQIPPICPHCNYVNILEKIYKKEITSTKKICTFCGDSVDSNEAESVCNNCKASHSSDLSKNSNIYNVKRSNIVIFSNVNKDNLIKNINLNLIKGSDFCNDDNEKYLRLNKHPDFKHLFVNDKFLKKLSRVNFSKIKTILYTALKKLILYVLLIVFLSLFIFGIYYSNQKKLFVFSDLYDYTQKIMPKEKKSNTVIKDDLFERKAKPFIESLSKKYKSIDDPGELYFLRGRKQMLLDSKLSKAFAQSELEKAVLANPYNNIFLSTLAEFYAQSEDAILHKDAFLLIEAAEYLNDKSVELCRAKIAIFVATKNYADGGKTLEECNKDFKDAELLLYSGILESNLNPKNTQVIENFYSKSISLNPNLYKTYYELAKYYFSIHEYGKANTLLLKKLQNDKNNGEIYLYLGLLHQELGLFDKAISYFDNAYKLMPKENFSSNNLAVALYQSRSMYMQASSLLLKDQKLNKNFQLQTSEYKNSLLHHSTILNQLGRFKESLQISESLLLKDSVFMPALFQKAISKIYLGDLNNAGVALRKISESEHDNKTLSIIRFYMGWILEQQGRYEQAIDDYQTASDLDALNTNSKIALMNMFLKTGQNEKLEDLINKIWKEGYYFLNNNTKTIPTNYYHSYPKLSMFLAEYQKNINNNDSNDNILSGLGYLYIQTKQYPSAINTFSKILQETPENEYALSGLGISYYLLNDKGTSISYFNKLLSIHKFPSLSYIFLTKLYIDTGRLKEAIETANLAQQYYQNDAYFYDLLAMIKYKSGSTKNAIELFKKALIFDPTYIPSKQHLFFYDK